jgi:phosphoribosylformylglycinamidine cyclo-ligase
LTDVHNTVGIDLVAMCVNDAICTGAEPLFFLDYVAMSHDDPALLEQIVQGISDGCVQADCALLGGETAIMPDLYGPGDYDLAGFCVGVVERNHVLDGSAIAPNDIVIGVESSGIHSNGFSLVRKVVFDMAGHGVDDMVDPLGQTVGQVLMTPTRIYARAARNVLNHYKVKNVVHGIAHITGGGLLENLQRILPDGAHAYIRRESWQVPPVFAWLQELGGVADEEMDRVFNRGIGLVLVVSAFYANPIRRILEEDGLQSWEIGFVGEGPKGASWAS